MNIKFILNKIFKIKDCNHCAKLKEQIIQKTNAEAYIKHLQLKNDHLRIVIKRLTNLKGFSLLNELELQKEAYTHLEKAHIKLIERSIYPIHFKEVKLENLFTIEEIKNAAKLSEIFVETSQGEEFLDGRLEDLLTAIKHIKRIIE